MIAAYEAAGNIAGADPSKDRSDRICFGGLAAIELLRSGTPIRGAVAFHCYVGTFYWK